MAFWVFIIFLSFSTLSGQDKVRIYLTDVPAWTLETDRSNSADQNSSKTTTLTKQSSLVAEAMEHFYNQKDCKGLQMTFNPDKADYAFIFTPPSSLWVNNKNVMVVKLDEDQDIIYGGDAVRFKNVVKDACQAVKEDLSPPQ